jgi:hypothetical protein
MALDLWDICIYNTAYTHSYIYIGRFVISCQNFSSCFDEQVFTLYSPSYDKCSKWLPSTWIHILTRCSPECVTSLRTAKSFTYLAASSIRRSSTSSRVSLCVHTPCEPTLANLTDWGLETLEFNSAEIHGQSTYQGIYNKNTTSFVDWNLEAPFHAVGTYVVVLRGISSKMRDSSFCKKRGINVTY